MTLTIGFAELLTVVGGILLAVIWLIRLEGKFFFLQRMQDEMSSEIKELRTKHEALDSKIVEKLSNVEKTLAKIEGRLSINNSNHLNSRSEHND
jgi:hypothetical protein